MDFSVGRLVPVKDHQIESVSKENAPRLFSEGSFLFAQRGIEGLKTAADWNSIMLRNSMELETGLVLKIGIKKCDSKIQSDCASDRELTQWFGMN